MYDTEAEIMTAASEACYKCHTVSATGGDDRNHLGVVGNHGDLIPIKINKTFPINLASRDALQVGFYMC